MNTKTVIIAAIALVLLLLGGIVAYQGTIPKETNTTAVAKVPLQNADFKYFEIKTPENSNFTIKNSLNETTKGMVYWKNTGNYSNEVQGISINKNLTNLLIHQNMELISNTTDGKIFESGGIYQIVKTLNDTDIIVTGSDLNLLKEMINSTKIKNTSNLTTPKPITPIEKVVDKKNDDKKTVENKKATTNEPKNTPKEDARKKTHGQIYIGGGIFQTGSGLEDKTHAKIYIDGGNPGESIIIKIKYYRDGNSLNYGNMVTATIHEDGYVYIDSADSYKFYPDKAHIELYDLDGNLQSTQTVTLTPDSSTQYF